MKDALLLTDSQCSVLQELSGRLSQLRTGTFEDKLPQVDSEAYTVVCPLSPCLTLPTPIHQPPPTSLIGLEVNPIVLRILFESTRGLGGA